MKTLRGTALPERLADIGRRDLYVRGELPTATPIAIVGSRQATPYGRRVASQLAARLANAGVPVISGLAFGIDVTAHQAALEAGGQAIAVLPTGLEEKDISPQTNLPVAHRIEANGGALISEYPPGTGARKEHYSRRNQVIAALAEHVVVIEAALPSGSLMTSRHAADLGREVWALPGPIDSLVSAGTNHLIGDGARPLLSVDEFVEELGLKPAPSQDGPLAGLGAKPVHLDELAGDADPSQLEAELTRLELRGLVKHVGGQYYVRA